MKLLSAIALCVTLVGLLASAGCGSSKHALVSITVSPATANATNGSTHNTAQFAVTGNYATYANGFFGPNATAVCDVRIPDTSKPLAQVTWTTSDSTNTSIDASGLATCTGMTMVAATITATASGICGVENATATLSCN